MTAALRQFQPDTGAWLKRLYAGLGSVDSVNRILDRMLADIATSETWHPSDALTRTRRQLRAAQSRIAELEAQLAQANRLAFEDSLTGCLNRRGLDALLQREIARSVRLHAPLSVALLDLDDFKQINDRYGHATGDQALRHLVHVLQQTLRASDAIGRFGGEEFAVVLADTPLEEALQTMQRVQQALRERPLCQQGSPLPIRFSAGVAAFCATDDAAALMARSDAALYCAKRAGKDCIVAAATAA